MAQLDDLRKKIDDIDNQMIALLNARMEVVKAVGILKNTQRSVIYRPEREKDIIDRLEEQSNGLLNRSAIEAIFLEVFAVSRNIELPERVAFLGPEGSFTHQAAESRFGAMSEYIPIATIESVFLMVETDRARFGVVPVENNQKGVELDTIHLLGDANLKIVAEVPLPIHYSFASTEDSIADIKKIYSVQSAFKQCSRFINEVFGKDKATLIPVDSTSTAARFANSEKGAAAICSHIAAKLYNLPILFSNIEDRDDNYTRYLILSKDFMNQKGKADKTTILAKIGDRPGDLARFLQDFNQKGINLKKIESIPAKMGKAFKYWFFLEFEGHYNDPPVKEILEHHKDQIKLLGSYVMLC